jgi:hypothetical protein
MSTSDRRRAQAQPSTGGVNRMCQTRPDRRRAQAQPSTGGVNRMCQTRYDIASTVLQFKRMGGI